MLFDPELILTSVILVDEKVSNFPINICSIMIG